MTTQHLEFDRNIFDRADGGWPYWRRLLGKPPIEKALSNQSHTGDSGAQNQSGAPADSGTEAA